MARTPATWAGITLADNVCLGSRADLRCPVAPRPLSGGKRTLWAALGMSAHSQKRTHAAPQQQPQCGTSRGRWRAPPAPASPAWSLPGSGLSEACALMTGNTPIRGTVWPRMMVLAAAADVSGVRNCYREPKWLHLRFRARVRLENVGYLVWCRTTVVAAGGTQQRGGVL